MENLLKAFAKCFNNERAHVDESIFNPSRILKAYGTVARKGEHTAERPWRVARLLDVPADMSVVSENELRTLLSDLEAKAAALPQIGLAPGRATVSTNGNREKNRKADSTEPIPFGQHDTTLHAIAWELRWDDLDEEQIYERLVEICETRCEGYGTDYKEMCRKHARSAAEQPTGTEQREQRNKNLLVSGKTLDQLEAESNAPKSHVANPRMIPTYNLTFKYPQVQGSSFDFVLGTRMGANEGWFPLGEPSLIAGPSGSNKSTLMLDLLEKQSRGEDFLGHSTFKRPFAIMAIDRGKSAQERTAVRMRINTAEMPEPIGLPSVQDGAALQVILQEIEGCNPMPSLVFIEGCDMLVSDPAKIQVVSPFLDGIRRVATHYHLAIVMSVGSAKTKVGEGYIAKRDNVFGSIAWGRMTETVAVLQYVEGDDTDSRRLLSVMLRNSAPEKYKMTMRDGRLVLDNDEEINPPRDAERAGMVLDAERMVH